MLSIFISFVVTGVLIVALLKTRLINLALDKPNERSLHIKVTPRTGGLALMLGVLVAWAYLQVEGYWLLLTLTLVFVSLVDDIRGLPVRWRLLTQLLVCGIFVYIALSGLPLFTQVFVWIGLVWLTNLYNFMDGANGLAGGMGLFGFLTYAVAAYLAGFNDLAFMCASVAAACLAFLIFNFNPAKIFMGDAGSVTLGFLAGAIGIYGWQHQVWPIGFALLVFSPFIVDASVTLTKRLLRGEKIWQAHRQHYYQRIIQMGWSHKKTALYAYLLMSLVSITAVLWMQLQHQVFLSLALWFIIYVCLALVIDFRWSRQLHEQSNQ